MKIVFFFSLLFLTLSCGSDFGNKVVGGNFTVYFTDVKDQELAEKIAVYFKENDLISSQKQDVQLVRENKTIQLRLISSSTDNIKSMPFEERKLLVALKYNLQKEVFKKQFDLVICNDKFEPIYTIDQ